MLPQEKVGLFGSGVLVTLVMIESSEPGATRSVAHSSLGGAPRARVRGSSGSAPAGTSERRGGPGVAWGWGFHFKQKRAVRPNPVRASQHPLKQQGQTNWASSRGLLSLLSPKFITKVHHGSSWYFSVVPSILLLCVKMSQHAVVCRRLCIQHRSDIKRPCHEPDKEPRRQSGLWLRRNALQDISTELDAHVEWFHIYFVFVCRGKELRDFALVAEPGLTPASTL